MKFDTRAVENLIRIARMVDDFQELKYACAAAEDELKRNKAAWETKELIKKVSS
jgi:hypothetical protein